MNAPKIQRIGKKIPKKNSHPCRFLIVVLVLLLLGFFSRGRW